MRRFVLVSMSLGLLAVPISAQGRRDSQGIPPGQLPPAGQCRVWYEGRPPGQQPRATNCRDAERIASRDRDARVIYGNGPVLNQRGPVAVPRQIPRIPGARPNTNGRDPYYSTVGYDQGYKDGYDKGRDDGRDNNRYDFNRQSRFRSADHGYNKRYGSKASYQQVYRDGYRSGYDEGYRDNSRNTRNNRRPSGINVPWPF